VGGKKKPTHLTKRFSRGIKILRRGSRGEGIEGLEKSREREKVEERLGGWN